MPLSSPLSIVVVGGGFGGMAAALRMRALGHRVTLTERLGALGGRAQVFERGGFRHDAGPTVITAPFLFEELFALFGEQLSDVVRMVALDPWYRFYFSDGRQFDYCADMAAMDRQIAAFNPADIQGYQCLLEASRKIFEVGFIELADQPFLRFRDMLAQTPQLIRLGCYRTVSSMVEKYIKDPSLQRVFSIHPLLVGGNPFSTTSIYTLIHFLERHWGIHFCMGGTGRLVQAMTELMHRQGVQVMLGTDVESFVLTGNRVTGVRIQSGETLSADLVICNADPPTVYREMMPRADTASLRSGRLLPESLTNYSMGLFVLFFGTSCTYPEVAHHTIWFGDRFRTLLRDIFDRSVLADDFSLYLHRPTATDPSFAPHGCDSFYVLCPVPNLRADIDWDQEGSRLRDRIVSALSRTVLPDLENTIREDFWMDPRDFRDQYRSRFGAGFSIAPTFWQSAWFRYHNRDPAINNLYFVGAGTHPGAGLPGVLSSAKVVERLVRHQFGAT